MNYEVKIGEAKVLIEEEKTPAELERLKNYADKLKEAAEKTEEQKQFCVKGIGYVRFLFCCMKGCDVIYGRYKN